MKTLLFFCVLSVSVISCAAEQNQAGQLVVQEALPAVIEMDHKPHLAHPVYSKYAWAKNGNGWKGVLLPMYYPNPQIMPEHQG